MNKLELPEKFSLSMREMLKDEYSLFIDSLSLPPSVSIRKNIQKSCSLGVSEIVFDGEAPIGWCTQGVYLPSRPSFTMDPLFHAGCYYVQEASSMFVSQYVDSLQDSVPLLALDLCAAPGGKSTLLLSSLPVGSLLFANEIVRQRCMILKENVIKWGNPNIIVTNNHSSDYNKSSLKFDVILCDAPCSGEGMFRKDAVSIHEWSAENVMLCAHRQKEILSDIWTNLKPGGLLIYSTCTYNIFEDELTARFIRDELKGQPVSINLKSDWGVDPVNYAGDDIPVYHFFPHRCRGEGFFICGFKKQSYTQEVDRNHKKLMRNLHKHKIACSFPGIIKNWIKQSEDYIFEVSSSGDIYAFPASQIDTLYAARQYLNIIYYGIHVASKKGKDYKPAHSLAMNTLLTPNSFPVVEVDYATAISYLRSESIVLPDVGRGYVLLTFNGYPLGFVNNVGNRANNLYPDSWRIKKYPSHNNSYQNQINIQ
jgi:16S rRNA C967 or C1407 C5-methylase (RsmB/RsmF family)/NOL1/NOP2/fmu family ribosome biogenesis protein